MTLEQARLFMVKTAAASVYQSASGLLADLDTEGEEKEIRAIADKLTDHVLAFTASPGPGRQALQAETAPTT
jgi:hypothetical protein